MILTNFTDFYGVFFGFLKECQVDVLIDCLLVLQIELLEHVNRKLGGSNGSNGLSKRIQQEIHQEMMSQHHEISDDEEDISTLQLRLSPRISAKNSPTDSPRDSVENLSS